MTGIIERFVRPFVKPVANDAKRTSAELFAHIDDIDRRLQHVEDEREASLRATTELFDQLPAFVIYKDLQDQLIFVNNYTASVVGQPVEDLVGMPCHSLWTRCLCNAQVEERIKRGEPSEARETAVELPGGGERRLFVWERPIRDAANRVMGIVLFALDIDTICTHPCPWKPETG